MTRTARSRLGDTVGGRILGTFFFLFFLVLGLIFCGLVLRESAQVWRTWTWTPVPCEILRSGVGESRSGRRAVGDFYVAVRYQFAFQGRSFTSEAYRRKRELLANYGKAARLARRFPPHSATLCYVNPASPSEAVLRRDNPLFFFVILFPLLFVAIGAGGIYFLWTGGMRSVAARPISQTGNPVRAQLLPAAFFLFFAVIGAVFFYALFVRTMMKIKSARTWPSVACVVQASEVKTHRGSKSTTYSANILYSYEFGGEKHKSNTYDFVGGSSSGYARNQAIVNRYPPGARGVCYVNPNDPTEAVLERRFTANVWIEAFPALFFFIGVGGLVSSLRKSRAGLLTNRRFATSFSRASSTAASFITDLKRPESLALKPALSRFSKLIGTIVIALFWNAIVSVFLFHAAQGRRTGLGWFLALFMVPFVLIGAGLIAACVYFFLGIFNARIRLRITPGAVMLGETMQVEWRVSGRVRAIQNLAIELRGREEATCRRGKNTSTAKNVFAKIEIANTNAHYEIQSGSAPVTVPLDSMHSFASANNKIIWSINVHGVIPRWPDLQDEFPVEILPVAAGIDARSL